NKEPRRPVRKNAWRMLFTPRRLALGGGVAVLFLFLFAISMPNLLMSRYALRAPSQVMKEREVQQEAARTAPSQTYTYDSLNSLTKDGNLNGLASIAPGVSGGNIHIVTKSGTNAERGAGKGEIDESEGKPGVPAVPMIARTAALTL